MRLTLEGPVELVIFVLEGQQYALPLRDAEHVLPMVAVSPVPRAPEIALGLINFHGKVIPVLDIRHRLGLPPREYGPDAYLLVALTSRRTVALPVDEVLGVREVQAGAVTRPDAVLPGIDQIAGIVTLSKGLLFIHDLNAFLSLDEEKQLAATLQEIAR